MRERESHRLREDHPHAYGDKTLMLSEQKIIPGSSPRVWGQVEGVYSCVRLFGIIPTRMGTRSVLMFICRRKRDHPHAYGDKTILVIVIAVMIGSSPRVWGQVNMNVSYCLMLRIIPTRMGTSYLIMSDFVLLRIIPTRMGTSGDFT